METYKANGVNGKGLFYRSLYSRTMYLIDNRVKCRMTIPDHYMQNGHSKKGFWNHAWLDKPIKFDLTSSNWSLGFGGSYKNLSQGSPTVRMRKGRCKLQWIATNCFILFGLIFIIIELELIKKEINTIKIQTQKGKGFE